MNSSVWLIGAGGMAREYIKVLNDLSVSFDVIGRGEQNAALCEEITAAPVHRGGLNAFLQNSPQVAEFAIVSVGIEALPEMTTQLLDYGVKHILLEKPGAVYLKQLQSMQTRAQEKGAHIFIAYNRRFYSSVIKAQEIIEQDEGVSSFSFRFSELSQFIADSDFSDVLKSRLFLCNSTHVADTAFYLGGEPETLASFHQGGTDWHPTAMVFSGSGISKRGALFSYHADWDAPARWSINVFTKQHTLIFEPMEQLKRQKIGSFAIEEVELDDTLDQKYKPGIYLQTQCFLTKDWARHCTLAEQIGIWKTYTEIAAYSE